MDELAPIPTPFIAREAHRPTIHSGIFEAEMVAYDADADCIDEFWRIAEVKGGKPPAIIHSKAPKSPKHPRSAHSLFVDHALLSDIWLTVLLCDFS